MELLLSLARHELQLVENCLQNQTDHTISLIPGISRYLMQKGGKRLRPMLLLACAHLYKKRMPKAAPSLAATIEFIHSATLLHDDVIDGAELRRGAKPAHHIWGNRITILVGDFLIAQAIKNIAEYGNKKILRVIANASVQLTEGELLQLQNIRNYELSREIYLKIIHAKTASLFSAACQIGGIIGGASENDITTLKTYGKSLGIVFQIMDDLLDYEQESNHIGKTQMQDLYEGKITLPLIIAREEGYDNLVQESLKNPEYSWKKLQNTLVSAGICQKVRDIAYKNLKDAEQQLNMLAIHEKNLWHQALLDATIKSINRTH